MPIENSLSSPSHEFFFESYGVRVNVEASTPELLSEAERTVRKALVDNVSELDEPVGEHTFAITSDESATLFLYKDGEQITYDDRHHLFFKFFDSFLRITIAENAVGRVFIHAGVVAKNGRAIVMPANSFAGKTTLVSELVKAGAEYYSDEYAVLDEAGLVHPFARDLSVRYFDGQTAAEKRVSISSIGGKVGSTPIPIGLVVLTKFEEGADWEPERLSPGQGILEMIPHTIPRIANTALSLKVLNTAVSDAIILKSPRGDAIRLASVLLSFF
jgi:hypothetical protein